MPVSFMENAEYALIADCLQRCNKERDALQADVDELVGALDFTATYLERNAEDWADLGRHVDKATESEERAKSIRRFINKYAPKAEKEPDRVG